MSVYDELLDGSGNRGSHIGYGVLTGIVKENYNEDFPGRVKVEFFAGEEGKNVTGWVRVASPYAGKEHGMYALPEIESEVVVAFEHGDRDCPIVIGCLWNEKDAIPKGAVTEKNMVKCLKTKGGHEIRFDEEEEKGSLTVLTPGKLKVTLSDEKKTVTIADSEGESKVVLDGESGMIRLDGKKKVVLSIGGTAALTIDGDGKKADLKMDNVSIEATQALSLKGQSVKIKASQVEVKADANLSMESGGVAKLKGSMVNIN